MPEVKESESANTLQNVPLPLPPHPERKIAELFLYQNPPTFAGTGNPSEVEDWVKAMEKIIKFLECTSKECLSCISYQLKGPADYWWESRQKTLTSDQLKAFTWEQFKEELYAKYIPLNYRRMKEIEFANLKQGKKTVAEYDHEFCSLARYASFKVETDEKKAELFRSGLHKEIRIALAAQSPMSYAKTLNRALDIEMELQPDKVALGMYPIPFHTQAPSKMLPFDQGFSGKRKRNDRSSPNKKPWQSRGQPFQKPLQLPYSSQAQYPPKQSREPPCPQCNKMYLGQCKQGSNVCYTCSQKGHFLNNCPNKLNLFGSRKKLNSSRPTRTLEAMNEYSRPSFQPTMPFQQNAFHNFAGFSAQPFQQSQQPQHRKAVVLNQKPTKKNTSNLTGMSRFQGIPNKILSDIRVSHFFISITCVDILELPVE